MQDRALQTGVDASMKERSGTFFMHDQTVVHTATVQEGLEIMDINDALAKYDWLQDYLFKLVQPDADKYTAYSASHPYAGYFLRALPGAKIVFPLQACLYMGRENMIQNVHNIIIAEEGSEFHIISGCTTDTHVTSGLHVGISEFYVKDNAKLTFTMVHNWAEDVQRPAAVLDAHGQERRLHEQLRVHDAGERHPDVPGHRHGRREQRRPLQHGRVRLERLALRPGLQGHPQGQRLQGGADRPDDHQGRLHRVPRHDPGRRRRTSRHTSNAAASSWATAAPSTPCRSCWAASRASS